MATKICHTRTRKDLFFSRKTMTLLDPSISSTRYTRSSGQQNLRIFFENSRCCSPRMTFGDSPRMARCNVSILYLDPRLRGDDIGARGDDNRGCWNDTKRYGSDILTPLKTNLGSAA